MQARWILNIVPWVALTIACAGQQEAVESPDTETVAKTGESDGAGDEGPATADGDDVAEGASEEPPKEAEPAEPPKRSGRPAAEILTTEDVAFTFDYNASAMKEAHEKKCEPAAKGDPGILSRCVQNERQKFHADVLWFRQEPNSEQKTWLVYKRQGNRLMEVFRSGFVFENEEQESVTMKLVDPAKGNQQIFYGRKTIPIGVPTKYGLVIDDPTFGELKYNSKVGLVAAQNQQQ